MTAIIWGADGQDGFYLSSLLKEQGIEVIGIGRSAATEHVDITNFEEVAEKVRLHRPDYIFHLAANSTTAHSAWKENHDTISTGSVNILEAVRQFAPESRVFLSGSGLQFVNNGNPIRETDAFFASSIYAVCRIHTVYVARYFRSLGVKAYVGYFFNHDSPLRSERHINKKILLAAQRIASGSNEKLQIGDVDVQKEFGFAGDIVKAVWTLVQQDTVHEAVLGTGIAYPISKWLDICFTLYGLRWEDHVEQLHGFVPEYRVLVSDPSTINSLGWKPETGIESLAKLMQA
ncbi:MAG TPA: GDP-mannose 4,6-dehydratase [Flavisolibacter sp.]